MRLALLALITGATWAQVPEFVIAQLPSNTPVEMIWNYTGTNLTSTCYARSTDTSSRRTGVKISISAASNASPVSLTSAVHGFSTSARPLVTISGGTGSWTAINGTFTAIITGANTFTIPVDSTAFGALTGTIVFSTTAPRSGQQEWAVYQITYDGSNNPIWKGWLGGSSALSAKCSDAGSTTLNVQ